ncbi:ABC transporter ATP-binding protein [Aquamicrobium segne]|uniref:ABC transporter ATP-binding protein n=1 Tax=Aquamicrobium segne TaxID=469547 RepID=A0ABW0H0I7_9HYPH
MAVVEFQKVSKQYVAGQMPAVDSLDLSCNEGEMLALLGPSGCGKSSTLKMAAGLEDLTSGEIFFDGRPISALPPAQRNVAMVFEDYCLYPNLSVEDNIGFPLTVQRVAADELDRRVSEITAMLGLEAIRKQSVRDLSGGAQQRVSIGRALIREPDLVLFDEPLSHLDGDQRVYLRSEISRLQKSRGLTSILVTHDQNEATAMADRIAILDGGKLQQVATPRELYLRPANIFVANFIGEPPMNLLEARIEDGKTIDIGVPGLALTLSSQRSKVVESRRSGGLVVGVRPEHVSVLPANSHDANAWLSYREPRGDVDVLTLTIEGPVPLKLVAEIDGPSSYRVNDRLRVDILADHVHLFDPESQANLEAAGGVQ